MRVRLVRGIAHHNMLTHTVPCCCTDGTCRSADALRQGCFCFNAGTASVTTSHCFLPVTSLTHALTLTHTPCPSLNACAGGSGSAPQRPHPVWGVPSPNVAGYIRLLQFLCGEELMRLRVWTEPLQYADSSRSLPVVRVAHVDKDTSSSLGQVCCRTVVFHS